MLKEIQIDSSHVNGEAGTGYEGPEKGPFSFSNCEFYSKGSCGQSTMMERSKLPKTENGRVVVDPGGCCEYVNRKGEKKEFHSSVSPVIGGYGIACWARSDMCLWC